VPLKIAPEHLRANCLSFQAQTVGGKTPGRRMISPPFEMVSSRRSEIVAQPIPEISQIPTMIGANHASCICQDSCGIVATYLPRTNKCAKLPTTNSTPSTIAALRHILTCAGSPFSRNNLWADMNSSSVTINVTLTFHPKLGAASLADFFAIVGGVNFDGAAHFVEARADAFADALGERILSRRRAHSGDAQGCGWRCACRRI